ncbi:3-deoxy-manno-octulosonate cytidylyltransferase [Thiohalomonas denitrificans]|uniref:3-deoxy-manno-octulosonate cytidylyltransferase n=1 Tax=Thiohalomonas denitrificans TaxID=415747 RepID=UPI0026EB2A5F|nr:3-deoxy-manno-octulosonate cytidylyltransferase [Thiohalomonas denitrificans]
MFRVFIPARYASQRLPGKPLLPIAGRSMLQHVYERAVASGAAQVMVVTDDERIADTVMGFGGEVLMTGAHHRSGTERIAEAIDALALDSSEVVVNLQGDEPLMPADLIRQVAEDLERFPTADIATLATRIHTAAELFDPHTVKVVMDKGGFALYFSRAVIPWDREAFAVTTEELPPTAEHYRHLGLYAYRAGFLSRYVDLPPCSIEGMESLEQLRVLWHGGRIHVAEAISQPGPGVDTEADLNRVRELLEV